jgi:hypothetical protein
LRPKITLAALAVVLAAGFVRAQNPTASSAAKKPAPASKATPTKATPSKPAATTSVPAPSTQAKSTTTTKKSTASKTTARPAPPPVRHYTPQQPTTDRFKEIQQALSDRGYFKGQVDGQWGQESVDALKQFQSEQKIDEDGKINSLSLIALGLGPHRNLPPSQAAHATLSSPRPPSAQLTPQPTPPTETAPAEASTGSPAAAPTGP